MRDDKYFEYLQTTDEDDQQRAIRTKNHIDSVAIWMAAINLAFEDFYYDGTVEELDMARRDATKWLMEDDVISNSFNNVCKHLGLNNWFIREALKKCSTYQQFKEYLIREHDLGVELRGEE